MARRQPEQRQPPVQRLRVRYGKLGPLRFASHRDIVRTIERAVRRAGLPVAYSSGFSPHPRLSYANPAPTGAASWAEYLEIGLTEVLDPAQVGARLGAAMPDGLPVTSVVETTPGESLADLLTASRWHLELGQGDGSVLADALARLVAAEHHEVVRWSGRGERRLDVAAALVAAECDKRTVPPSRDLTVLLAHGEPLVRPDDVVSALVGLEPMLAEGEVARFTRLAQGRIGQAGDPSDDGAGTVLDLPPGEADPAAFATRSRSDYGP